MNIRLADLLADDISQKTGYKCEIVPQLSDMLSSIKEGVEKAPLIQLAPLTIPLAKNTTYEMCLGNELTRRPYDIDHIPTSTLIALCIVGQSEEETETMTRAIQGIYNGAPDAGRILYPVDGGNANAMVNYSVKQIRADIAPKADFYIAPLEPIDYMSVPIPYPQDDFTASLNDRNAVERLLIAYFFYMFILNNNVLEIVSSKYPKLFPASDESLKGKLGNSKRVLFKKLRDNELTSGLLENNIASALTDSEIEKFAEAIQEGRLDKDAFDEYFSDVLFVIPDLYERAVRHESPDAVILDVQSKLSETQMRADAIADSLGIEENSSGHDFFNPRSYEAAEIYLQVFREHPELSVREIRQVYQHFSNEEAAQYQAKQAEREKLATDIVTGFTAGAIAAVVGGTAAEVVKSSQKSEKPDLIGTAGCAITQGRNCNGIECKISRECARG